MLIRFFLPSWASYGVRGRDHGLDEVIHVDGGGEEAAGVAVGLLVVGVAGDVVDIVVGVLQDGVLPRPERGHLRIRAAADHQLERRVDLAHGLRRLGGELAVVIGAAVTELPRPVHLVAEAPHPHRVRLDPAVLDPGVGQLGARTDVGVLEDVESLLDTAGAEVHRVHQLAVRLVQPAGELVDPDLVGLRGVPREVEPGRAVLLRADRVLPAEAGDEVAAGVADGRDTQLADELEYVLPEPFGVGAGVAGLVDPVVDAAAEVLDKGAEKTAVDGPHFEVWVEGQVG